LVTLSYLFSSDASKITCPRCLQALQNATESTQETAGPHETPSVPDTEALEKIAVLKAAIAKSGLTNSAYAREVLVRDPRSLRRWANGRTPIPRAVLNLIGWEDKTPSL